MSVPLLLLIVLALGLAGFFAGRMRALSVAGGDLRNLHSLPGFYGWSVAILASAPAILVMVIWIAVQPIVIDRSVSAMIPETAISDGSTRDLVMADVRRIAEGLDQAVAAGALTPDGASNIRAGLSDVRGRLAEVGVALGANVSSESLRAAQSYRSGLAAGRLGMTAVVLALALGGLGYGLARITPRFRARNTVELAVRMGLILCSMIAIATTAGIVLSMVFETVNFFGQYPWQDFFFGVEWSPNFRGNSSLGVLPLLWGTMYVSAIALAVAVPVGLFSAIYLSEYAGPKFRAVVKPAIEVLAGIPTIVYGLFALITVGPLLRDYIAQPLGLGDSGSSVMTAGLVMGVMIIPFVSSLSDDIINAVPQSLRDGSLALGATNSETIRQVILPAALPGIVGAVLLAASRAIGETMIVVLGAGAAARMSLNPFEAMTTMTVKIVSQLTGDTDFAAPETLVAFALGLTLFVITLALNIVALWIVRTYREQYE